MSDAQDIGKQLLAAREQMELTVAQAAERMRVDVGIIESLEAGRFNALGAPVFARGYLRQYAELLGEPLDDLTGRYETLAESSVSPDISAVPHLEAKGGMRRARWPLVVIAVVLILAAIVWWAMGVKSA
jgi:cytoskeleton protein RodZ